MSRRGPTRKQRIADLVAMLEHGPSFSMPQNAGHEERMYPKRAAMIYHVWAQSFVLDELRDLLRIKPQPERDGGVLEGTNRTTSGAIGQP